MPQLVGLILIGALGYFAWRALKREMARVDKTLREAESHVSKKETIETLEQDPQTGVYQPKNGDRS